MAPVNQFLSVKPTIPSVPLALDFGHSLEVQPGLIVCTSTSADLEASYGVDPIPSDSEYIHLSCMLQGHFEARLRDVSLQCAAGDINMGFSAGEIFHTGNCLDFCNFTLMITHELLQHTAGDELAGLNSDKELRFFVKNAQPSRQVTALARQITSLIKQKPVKSLLLHSAILNYLYWHLSTQQQDKPREVISFREKKQLTAARDYLLLDLSSPPTIAKLARTVGLNQCKLKKGFKDHFGSSIYAYFLEQRMHTAMQLLKKYNVTETAMELGYSNVSHFSTAFRKQFGVLPKEARRDMAPILPPINTLK